MPNSTSIPSTAPSSSTPWVSWGDFTLTDDDVAEFRAALRADCSGSVVFTDDEIREMAYDTINFIALVVELKEEHTT